MFRLATNEDVNEIQKLLTDAWRVTYKNLYSEAYIESVIVEFFNEDRLLKETSHSSKEWSGYYVLVKDQRIVGCIGGGVSNNNTGEIYVLYLDPSQKRKGYGITLVNKFTEIQKDQYSITRQKVSVSKGNEMGIPFYKRLGFDEYEVRDTYYQDANENYQSISMIREV